MRSVVVAIAAVAASSFLTTSGAYAACAPSTPPDAAVAQYVEQVPTSCGSQSSNGPSHKTALPKRVQKRVQKAGRRASALETIATDSTYGAPQQALPARTTTTTSAPAPTVKPNIAPAPRVHKKRPHAKPVHKEKTQTHAVVVKKAKPTVPTVHVTVAPTTSGVQSGRVIALLVVLFGATIAVFATARRRRGPRAIVS